MRFEHDIIGDKLSSLQFWKKMVNNGGSPDDEKLTYGNGMNSSS